MNSMNISQIFIEESARSGWKDQTEPKALFVKLGETIENTRVRAAGLCFGSQLRTDVCNALFRCAAAGAETAAAAALGVAVIPGKDRKQPAGKQKDKDQDEKKTTADFLQPALLGAGFVLSALTISVSLKRPLSLLSPFAALVLGVAFVREVQKMRAAGELAQLARVIIRKKKLADTVIELLKLEKQPEQPAEAAGAAEADKTDAPEQKQQAIAQDPAARAVDAALIEKLDALCLKQMAFIEQNLPVFEEAPAKPDEDQVLWPLVRTMLQKKYADETAFPEEVEDELSRYFRANGLSVYEYGEEHAALFKTQPMNETFTIFPAIVGQDGRIVEYGQACVKTEEEKAEEEA